MIGFYAAGAMGAAPAPPVGSYWNPADMDSRITLSNGNATATRSSAAAAWCSVRGVTSRSSGKWYAECVDDVDVPGAMMFGVGTVAAALNNYPGSGTTSWGLQANNNTRRATYYNGSQTNQGGTSGISTGGRGLLAIDFDNGRIWFGDSSFGWYTGDPAAGTGATYTFAANTALHLMLGEQANPQQCTLKNQVGENALSIPSGFSMWG